MTKAQAIKDFRASVLEFLAKGDMPQASEEWSYFTDQLYKEGRITDKQLNNWTNPYSF